MKLHIERVLLSSKEAAREVAFAFRGTWDGCNGVHISQPTTSPDTRAFIQAIRLANAEYCFEWDVCIVGQKDQLFRRMSASNQDPTAAWNLLEDRYQCIREILNILLFPSPTCLSPSD